MQQIQMHLVSIPLLLYTFIYFKVEVYFSVAVHLNWQKCVKDWIFS